MDTEKTYRVRRSDLSERAYRLYELTWLWRTAEMPHDAVYLHEDGDWRPVSALVEPVLEAQRARENTPSPPVRPRRHALWLWGLALCGLLVVGSVVGPDLQRGYSNWKAAKIKEREALAREQEARKQDFIANSLVIPGMTHDEVRRTVGPPASIKATGDGKWERWLYRSQVIVFENGKVVGIEGSK